MSLLHFRFPQISRFFSATLIFIALWAGFGLMLAVNGLNRKTIMVPPNFVEDEAILGATAAESARLTEQFNHWKFVTQEKPDYRDAFLMAASLAYQLGNKQEARTLISSALTLDPASSLAGELREIIGED